MGIIGSSSEEALRQAQPFVTVVGVPEPLLVVGPEPPTLASPPPPPLPEPEVVALVVEMAVGSCNLQEPAQLDVTH